MNLLEVKDLSTGYGSENVLEGCSFKVGTHEIVGILGTNGCGKTTLLKALCGLLPARGEIRLKGEDIRNGSPKKLAQVCRYIPQRTGIGLEIPVEDVVLMGFNPELSLLAKPSGTMRREALRMLERTGLVEMAERDFQTLSEGQKQLCVLARSLLLKNGMLYLDEPESSLDLGGRYRMMQLLRQWADEREGSVLVTLHDPQLALNTCDRILMIRDGRILSEVLPGQEEQRLTEKKLAEVFGALSIHSLTDRVGRERLLILKEDPE